ncbi:Cyclolysin [Shimia thalassica]|uniref:Cyclolysin n=1 Tax=Shimia thalassica TaxID=1715693 RepID=A0A0P1I3E8_9RHOB|nr:calcium-binding protein [Shimia thalassica]CUJ87671.1 Cyclolysin [Shimia thalassica]
MIISPSIVATNEVQIANTNAPSSGVHGRSSPNVTALEDGGFVITWVSEGNGTESQDGSGSGIFGQRFDVVGNRVGEEFQINTTTQYDQRSPEVAALPDGGFYVVWSSEGWTDFAGGIFGQRFDQEGVPVGGEEQISAPGNIVQWDPEIVSYPDGSLFVGWIASDNDSQLRGIFGRGYTPEMTAISDEFVLDQSTASYSNLSLAAVGQEGFVAAWGIRDFRYQITSVFFSDMEGQTSDRLFITDQSRVSAFQINGVQNVLYGTDQVFLAWSDYRTYGEGTDLLTNFQVIFDLDGSTSDEAEPLEVDGNLGDVIVLGDQGMQFVVGDEIYLDGGGYTPTVFLGYRGYLDTIENVNSETNLPITSSYRLLPAATQLNNGSIVYAWDAGYEIAFQQYRSNSFATGSLDIIGSPFAGELLTALPIGIDDPDGVGDFSYQWLRGGENIEGANSSIYTLSEEDVGLGMSVRVQFTDGLGTLETILSGTVQQIGVSLVGTDANDSLTGSYGNDQIRGVGGNDTIHGGQGVDVLSGDDGDDQITGRGTIVGGGGADLIFLLPDTYSRYNDYTNLVEAGEGNDSVSGSGTIFAGPGDDVIVVEGDVRLADTNSLYGESGDDTIYADGRDDFISGGSGQDVLSAGDGNDFVNPGSGVDIITMGNGTDTVYGSSDELNGDTIHGVFENDLVSINSTTFFGSPVIIQNDDLTTLSLDLTGDSQLDFHLHFSDPTILYQQNIFQTDEGVLIYRVRYIGTENDDWINGTDTDNTIEGLAGSDTLKGYAGNDLLEGGAGGSSRGDSLYGGIGNDTLFGASSSNLEGDDTLRDRLEGGEGNDLLVGGAANDSLFGNEDRDTLIGGSGNDFLNGAHGSDRLEGGSGSDRLDGGTGNDLLFGGADDDSLSGSIGNDTLFGEDGRDILAGESGNDSLDGGNSDDVLNGGDGNDTLIGGEGNDTLIGGESEDDLRDVIYGGVGDDTIDGGYGNDELRGDAGNDTIAGGFGADTVIGGVGHDTLTGSAFADQIFSGDGDDFVNGGWGHDLVNGGAGADRFFHIGIVDHGSDWIQDYNSAERDVLQFGITSATVRQFQVNFTHTESATGERSGDDNVEEAFVIYRPTGQIVWALVDGEGQSSITIQIGSDVFDLLA